jgi:hypothetical protein
MTKNAALWAGAAAFALIACNKAHQPDPPSPPLLDYSPLIGKWKVSQSTLEPPFFSVEFRSGGRFILSGADLKKHHLSWTVHGVFTLYRDTVTRLALDRDMLKFVPNTIIQTKLQGPAGPVGWLPDKFILGFPDEALRTEEGKIVWYDKNSFTWWLGPTLKEATDLHAALGDPFIFERE